MTSEQWRAAVEEIHEDLSEFMCAQAVGVPDSPVEAHYWASYYRSVASSIDEITYYFELTAGTETKEAK